MEQELVYPELSYKIVGVLYAVHNEVGRYKNEKQYGDCFEKYLTEFGIPYEREKILPESFKGEEYGRNKVDFLIDGKVIIELKAKRFVTRQDYFQTMRYLEALQKKLGILVNFRQRYLAPKRVLNSRISDS